MHGKMDLDMLDSKRDEVMSILVSCFCMKKACLFGGFYLINTLHTLIGKYLVEKIIRI